MLQSEIVVMSRQEPQALCSMLKIRSEISKGERIVINHI